MKFKMSQKQWESIGKKANWMKKEANPTQPGRIEDVSPEDPGSQSINSRVRAMIDSYNKSTGNSLPFDMNGYNQIGRSQGVLQALSQPDAFANFVSTSEMQTFLSQNPNYAVELIRSYFLSISRS